ncbi:hypothetical protein [Georhizobium sp. MAB10]|uniref:hypothetical protein n=1 Tax=Georhizobium sp. MAB10 TaxID=3028319 RepID=UPI0038556B64
MSARLLGLGFGCDMGTPCRKLILLKLIDACDDDGSRIFPAVATIARAAQCSTRQVQRELSTMVDIGLLAIVRAGGCGPKSTREYAMDLTVLRRIEADGWNAVSAQAPANKGDTVSPLADDDDAPKGDMGGTPRVTPATDKGDSHCHPTPPYPSKDPSEREARERGIDSDLEGQDESETVQVDSPKADEPKADEVKTGDRPGTADFEKRVMRLCNGRGFDAGPWKNWDTSSPGHVARQFAKLTADERLEAERWRDAYLRDVERRKKQPIPIANYLRDKLWNGLDPKILERAEKAALAAKGHAPSDQAAPFGKAWGAHRFIHMLQPHGPLPKPSLFIQTMIERGGDEGERYRLQHLATHGWPLVNRMHTAAAQGRGWQVGAAALALGESFEKVRSGSAEWEAWRALHERRGWPWLPDGPDWIWMPAGKDPDAAMVEFEKAVKARDADDDDEAA